MLLLGGVDDVAGPVAVALGVGGPDVEIVQGRELVEELHEAMQAVVVADTLAVPIEKLVTKVTEELLSEGLGEDVGDVIFGRREGDADVSLDDLLLDPVKPDVDVARVLVLDWSLRNFLRGLVVS